MQTFLPYSSFLRSAEVLDNKRLGKQRLEAKQILQINIAKLENPNIVPAFFVIALILLIIYK